MTRRPLMRLTSAGASAALALMLLGVSGVAAAPPTWSISATPIPDTVSPGSPAAYSVTISNTGKYLIPFLFLTDSRSEAPLSVTPSKGCKATGPLLCSLGPLLKGKSVTVVVVYQTPPSGSSFNVTFTATKLNPFPWFWWWSHRSAFEHIDASASTTLNNDPGFVGVYVLNANQLVSTQPVTGEDTQQTTLHAPKAGIGVTISESNDGNPCGVENPIGQQADLNVGGGAHFTTAFLTTLTIDAATLPDELQLSQLNLCHQYDGDEGGTLLPSCASIAGPPANGAACFWPRWGGDYHPDAEGSPDEVDADDWGLLFIDVWDYENGNLRGGY